MGIWAGIYISPSPSPSPVENFGYYPYPYPYPVKAGIPVKTGTGTGDTHGHEFICHLYLRRITYVIYHCSHPNISKKIGEELLFTY